MAYWVSLPLVQDSHCSFCHRGYFPAQTLPGSPPVDSTPQSWGNIPSAPQSLEHLLLVAVSLSDSRVTSFGLSASRAALSARRSGRRIFSAPTAIAGCAALAQRNTGMPRPRGAHSLLGHRRDPQVPAPPPTFLPVLNPQVPGE